jgi:hypothetical protein
VRERYDHGRPVSDLSSSILLRPQVCCVLFLGLFDAVTTFEEKETEGARRGSKPPISLPSPPPSSVRVVFCIVHLGRGLYGTHWQDGIKDMSSPLANNRLHVRRPSYTTPGWPLRLFGHRVQRRVLHCSWALAVQHTQSVHMYMKICRASFVQVLLVASSSSYLLRLPAMEP